MKFLKSLISFILVVIIAMGLVSIALAQEEVKTITIKAWTIGPDDPSITRRYRTLCYG